MKNVIPKTPFKHTSTKNRAQLQTYLTKRKGEENLPLNFCVGLAQLY